MTTKNERKRDDVFAESTPTAICLEVANPTNEYIAQKRYLRGYDVESLALNCDFIDSLYLNLVGELPEEKVKDVLNQLMVAYSNLGARYVGSRAAMNAGIGRTNISHILPIALCASSGSVDGSQAVIDAYINISKLSKADITDVLNQFKPFPENDLPVGELTAGFNSLAGNRDPIANSLLKQFLKCSLDLSTTNWCSNIQDKLENTGFGISLGGLFASICIDLKIDKKTSLVLFQIAIAPSLAAFGLEKYGKPLTEMPFLSEDKYKIEGKED
ncbi:MAG: hypothetical protein GJ680_03390 [Alteromonadaceae bacterium]|nr:hypothetical protein [Alteromonadaceae bacterium]